MLELELFLSAFAVLFVIIDPPGCAPIFATLTRGTSRKHQVEMAFKSVFIAAIILSGFAYAGEFIFAKLGISLDSLRIAEIGRAHVRTPVTEKSRMPSSA